MLKILKMTENEAMDYVTKEGGLEGDASQYVRYCHHCGCWVHVDDYSGNIDKCDECDEC